MSRLLLMLILLMPLAGFAESQPKTGVASRGDTAKAAERQPTALFGLWITIFDFFFETPEPGATGRVEPR